MGGRSRDMLAEEEGWVPANWCPPCGPVDSELGQPNPHSAPSCRGWLSRGGMEIESGLGFRFLLYNQHAGEAAMSGLLWAGADRPDNWLCVWLHDTPPPRPQEGPVIKADVQKSNSSLESLPLREYSRKQRGPRSLF